MDQSASQADAMYREHVRALHTIKWWRSLFVLLAVLAPLTHMAAWGSVQFYHVLESDVRSAQMDREAGKDEGANLELSKVAKNWEIWMQTVLPLAEMIGRCAVVLLAVTMLLAAMVILSGRLPGVASVIRAFFLSVIVATMFVPWERLAARDATMPGVFTTVEKLKQLQTSTIQKDDQPGPTATQPVEIAGRLLGSQKDWHSVADAARFAALPSFAVLFLLIAGGGFGRAYRLASAHRSSDIPMKTI